MSNVQKMKFFTLLCLGAFFGKWSVAIDIDDINVSNCTSGTYCEDSTTFTTPFIENPNNMAGNSKNGKSDFSTTENPKKDRNLPPPKEQTTENPATTTTTIPTTSATEENDVEPKIDLNVKNRSNVCTCDLKISSCDINCCCDPECDDFQKSTFSKCDDHRPKIYDSRYCYTKNFIQRNNTQFILERLASNLFCIAYDNLPPIYGMSDIPTLRNRQAFEQTKSLVNPKKYTWDWPDSIIPQNFNFTGRYRDKESIWKFQDRFVQLIELPQSGFTGQCSFGKNLKYLETSKWTCMQTNLSDDNSYLFSDKYTNFTVVSSPHLFNVSYTTTSNQTCPSNVCLPLRVLYCSQDWSNCSSKKPFRQYCANGSCTNVINRLRYTFFHNGTNGIRNVEVRLVLANKTQNFYQSFEIFYEWAKNRAGVKFSRSGSPGYTIGKPIVIGTFPSNASNPMNKDQIRINPNYHLTVAIRGQNGRCISDERYPIGFGENVRLRCHHESTTTNFSSLDCHHLQNQTLRLLMEDSLDAISQTDKYGVYVSKAGDLLINDINEWSQILLDKIPRNVITGQILNDQIRCSAIVRSIHLEILYTIMPNHEELESYKIAGVALTFSDPEDLSWTKCWENNCSDVMKVELTSIVTFTDISTPAMYYYAGGPNLDISLPYDFFYPFMSNGNNNRPVEVMIGLILICFVLKYVAD